MILAVKLPELLAYVNMEEEALSKLQQNLLDFLKYRILYPEISYIFYHFIRVCNLWHSAIFNHFFAWGAKPLGAKLFRD